MNVAIILAAKYLVFAIETIALIYASFQPRSRQIKLGLLALLSAPGVYIVSKLASALYSDPRPFIVGHFTPPVPAALGNGFPSGHMLTCATIAAVIYPYNKPLSLLLWLLAILVGVARVLAGVHHIIDIVGAMVIAIATVAVIYKICDITYWHRSGQS